MNENCFKVKKKLSVLLLISNVIEVLLLTVIATGMFSGTMYTLREIIAIVANIGFIIILIQFIIWIVSIVSCKKKPTHNKSPDKTMSALVVVACLMTIFSIYVFSQGVTSSAYYPSNIQKISSDGNYYLVIMEQNIKVTESQFNKIESDKGYAIEYSYNKFLKTSKVLYIEDDTGNRF